MNNDQIRQFYKEYSDKLIEIEELKEIVNTNTHIPDITPDLYESLREDIRKYNELKKKINGVE